MCVFYLRLIKIIMRDNIILIIGFSFFGAMVGYITGISNAEITQSIVAVLFTFIGGKIFIDINNENTVKNKIAGLTMLFFSILFLVSLNLGIYVKVNRLLTNPEHKSLEQDYLRSFKIDNNLELKYRRGEISGDSIVKIILNENGDK